MYFHLSKTHLSANYILRDKNDYLPSNFYPAFYSQSKGVEDVISPKSGYNSQREIVSYSWTSHQVQNWCQPNIRQVSSLDWSFNKAIGLYFWEIFHRIFSFWSINFRGSSGPESTIVNRGISTNNYHTILVVIKLHSAS